eukprot:COSAG01_NODE_16538_length_1228_cov_1.040744_1_plen_378_part_10
MRPPRTKHQITLAQHIAGGEVEVTIGRTCATVTIEPRAHVSKPIFILPRPGLKLGAYVTFVVGQGSARGALNVTCVNLSDKALKEQGFGSAEEKLIRYWRVREALQTLQSVKDAESALSGPQCLLNQLTATHIRQVQASVSQLEGQGSEQSGDALLIHEVSAQDALIGCMDVDGVLDLSEVGLANDFRVGHNPNGTKWMGVSDGDIKLYPGQGFPRKDGRGRGQLAVLFRVKRLQPEPMQTEVQHEAEGCGSPLPDLPIYSTRHHSIGDPQPDAKSEKTAVDLAPARAAAGTRAARALPDQLYGHTGGKRILDMAVGMTGFTKLQDSQRVLIEEHNALLQREQGYRQKLSMWRNYGEKVGHLSCGLPTGAYIWVKGKG